MLRAFRNCGLLSFQQLNERLGMCDRRIKNFKRDGYIEQARLPHPKTKELLLVFQLSDKGKRLVESELNLQDCYRSSGGLHDLRVADEYLSLNDGEKFSWKTEAQLREDSYAMADRLGKRKLFEENYKNGKFSATDGAYLSSQGQMIAVEVVTRNYKASELEAKRMFAQAMQMSYEPIRI